MEGKKNLPTLLIILLFLPGKCYSHKQFFLRMIMIV